MLRGSRSLPDGSLNLHRDPHYGRAVTIGSGNRLLYRDGVPVALLSGGELSFRVELPPQQQWEARKLLLRRHVPAVLADLA